MKLMKIQMIGLLWMQALLVAAPLALQAQKTVITGTAPGAEGKIIKVTGYADLVTQLEETIASTEIDSSGHFTLSFTPGTTRYTIPSIDFHQTELFVEPGKTYNLRIAPLDYNKSLEVNPFLQSESLEADMINPGQNELNIWIRDYNQKYDQFLVDHFNLLYLERSKATLDTFRYSVNALFTDVDNPYFQDYITYKTAGLVQLAKTMSTYQIAKLYFNGKPILYQNTEYMRFFNNFFSKYISTSQALRKADLAAAIKGPQPFTALVKIVSADTLIKDDNLRELVILKNLQEVFYSNTDLQEPVISAVAQAVTECKAEENRKIATNMLKKLTHLRTGTPAPTFTLPDRNRKEVSLAGLRGKPVVLSFWTTYCQGCLTEFELLKPIYAKYRDRVNFVSISADKDFIKMQYFLKMKPDFSWTFVHLDQKPDLLVDYDVRSYPLFVLIDRDGKIYKYPAAAPSEGLEKTMTEWLGQ